MTYKPGIIYRNDAGVCPCGERDDIKFPSFKILSGINVTGNLRGRDISWNLYGEPSDITTFTVSEQFDSDVKNSIVGPVDYWSPIGVVDGVGPVRVDEVGRGIAPKSTIDRVFSETYVPESAKKKTDLPTMREVRDVIDRILEDV